MIELEKQKKMVQLYGRCTNTLVQRFFDLYSTSDLDLKIMVLDRLNNGEEPIEISEFYDILELYPKTKDIWD